MTDMWSESLIFKLGYVTLAEQVDGSFWLPQSVNVKWQSYSRPSVIHKARDQAPEVH